MILAFWEGFKIYTLESEINVRSGIRVRVGICGRNNKSTVWNKHTGGKIQNCLHCKIRNSSAIGYVMIHFLLYLLGSVQKN